MTLESKRRHSNYRRSLTARIWTAAGLGVAFVVLAVVAHQAEYGTAIDHAVLYWLVEGRRGAITSVAVGVTNAGSPAAMFCLALIACVVLWWRSSIATATVVALTLASAYGLSTATKAIVGAHRPPRAVQLMFETDPSYPSGHVTGTVALVGILAVVIGTGRDIATRAALAAVVALLVIAVAVTRLYLGVHWLTDVLGGVLLGGIAIALASAMLAVAARSPRVSGISRV
jgi:membrane-associated phospholipid phosphatase